MRVKSLSYFAAAAMIIGLAAVTTNPQTRRTPTTEAETTTQAIGTVSLKYRDGSSTPVADADVTFYRVDREGPRGGYRTYPTKTDRDGIYRQEIALGTYIIIVSAAGANPAYLRDVLIDNQRRGNLHNFELEVGDGNTLTLEQVMTGGRDATRRDAGRRPTGGDERSGGDRSVILGGMRPKPITTAGHYYALVIGNNDYQNLTRLLTAENDARSIESVLKEKYGFETKLLLNADRQKILTALNEYRRSLNKDANLLIYYAGHGFRDKEVDKAYWLPVDARADYNVNWISADDITSNIKGVPARHVLIISDSCYSGTIYRGMEPRVSDPIQRDLFLQKMMGGKSRHLMASGGNEPVADGGAEGHSVFAKALLVGFDQMDDNQFTATELFSRFVLQRVAGNSGQTPEYAFLLNSGHESGDFIFVRRE